MTDSNFVSHRVLDAGSESGALRPLLHGMFPKDLPVASLTNALDPVKDSLPNLPSMLKLAVKHIANQKKKGAIPSAMPHDSCLAIMLYTMEDQPRENSLYYRLNLALRAKDRSSVRPWRDFIWLFLHALKCLPPSNVRLVYRGVKLSLKDLAGNYQKGEGIYSCLLPLCSDKNVIFFCNFKIFYKNLIQI